MHRRKLLKFKKKKSGNSVICGNVDESDNCADRNKPDKGRQIIFLILFMC